MADRDDDDDDDHDDDDDGDVDDNVSTVSMLLLEPAGIGRDLRNDGDGRGG